jgi:hypothetical protein
MFEVIKEALNFCNVDILAEEIRIFRYIYLKTCNNFYTCFQHTINTVANWL